MLKGCQAFLAHVTTKETEDKLKEKQLEDVLIVQDFPEIPGATPVAREPYRLAPSERKELSEKLKELSEKGFINPVPHLGELRSSPASSTGKRYSENDIQNSV
ncbi:hypothetical protein Tco_1526189, partial [Tanacetum coccineum]